MGIESLMAIMAAISAATGIAGSAINYSGQMQSLAEQKRMQEQQARANKILVDSQRAQEHQNQLFNDTQLAKDYENQFLNTTAAKYGGRFKFKKGGKTNEDNNLIDFMNTIASLNQSRINNPGGIMVRDMYRRDYDNARRLNQDMWEAASLGNIASIIPLMAAGSEVAGAPLVLDLPFMSVTPAIDEIFENKKSTNNKRNSKYNVNNESTYRPVYSTRFLQY